MAQEYKNSSFDSQIEDNLRRVYERTVNEEIPDRFKDLLAQLKAQETAQASSGKGNDGENSQ
nr:NepR family anti-sigma factor [uncultured Celeribacter sp.]